MIEINCTNCKTLLQIDDAFAGGVCRCRHCGTIQTVPKRLKNSGGSQSSQSQNAVGSDSSSSQRTGVAEASGTGLDDLAGIVASSGLTSARLLNKPKPAAKPEAPKKDNRTFILIASAGVVILLLLGIIIFMATRDKGGNDNQTNAGGGGSGNPNTNVTPTNVTPNPKPNPVVNTGNPSAPPRSNVPSFLGQPISEKSVAYVLDRGAASSGEHRLDLLKTALLNSIRSLGPDAKFAVIFWQLDGEKIESWPAEGLRHASTANINELNKFLDEIYSVGQTKAPPATERAFKTGAEAVIIVPIKTFIEPGTHTAIVKSREGSNAHVYCYTLGQSDIGESFQKVANDTHGVYKDISMDELRAAAQ